jgi:GNAT superfamily N-acetyltransferase
LIKGCKIKHAQLDNCIDIYALLKEAVKEGIHPEGDGPDDDKALKQYYITGLLEELRSPNHIYWLAARGRGYLGYLHAVLVPDVWTKSKWQMLIEMVYVKEKRRKNGIGKGLIEEAQAFAKENKIEKIILMGKDDMLPYWEKRGAKKLSNYMRIDV